MPLRLPHRHLAPCPLVPLRHSYRYDFLPSIPTSAPESVDFHAFVSPLFHYHLRGFFLTISRNSVTE